MVLILVFLLLLSGCSLGPPYDPPCVETPKVWKNAAAFDEAKPNVDYWWEVFEDSLLNELIQDSLQNSPTIFTALQRVEESRALMGVSKADLFPELSFDPSYSNGSVLSEFESPSGSALFRVRQTAYTLPVNLSYELDLWGIYRGQYDYAQFQAQAQQEIYLAALLTLSSEVASAYFQLRSLDAQIQLLQDTAQVRLAAYEVNDIRFKAGLINYTDVSRASLLYTNAKALLFDMKRLRSLQENRLAYLKGIPPSNFTLPAMALQAAPPSLPADLPSAVLQRRPDIAKVEREMAAWHALIGVAKGAFFPQVSLTGALGYSSPNWQQLLSWKSRLWEIGASILQNIFDGGRNSSELQAAWARFEQSSGIYQDQILLAFKEVEDALADIEYFAKAFENLQESVKAAQLTTHLSKERYNKGLVNYLEVSDSERAQLEAQVNAIDFLGRRYISLIQLIKAIGGGWANSSCQPDLQ